VDVHQDQIVRLGLQRLEGLAPTFDGGYLKSSSREQTDRDIAIHRLIVDDEQALLSLCPVLLLYHLLCANSPTACGATRCGSDLIAVQNPADFDFEQLGCKGFLEHNRSLHI